MDKYMMVDPEAESLQEKVMVMDHLLDLDLDLDLDSAIKITDEQIDKAYRELEILREQKAKLETEKLLKDFEEGEYYRLDDRGGCLSYYFRYSKSNFHVQDMTGTVGYTGENDVIISHGLKVFATRSQYQAGFFHSLYLHLSYFHNCQLVKIDKEDFDQECSQIVEYVNREVENVGTE